MAMHQELKTSLPVSSAKYVISEEHSVIVNLHILLSQAYTLTQMKGFFLLSTMTKNDFQDLHLIMSAPPCRADLFASRSLEAPGEKNAEQLKEKSYITYKDQRRDEKSHSHQ